METQQYTLQLVEKIRKYDIVGIVINNEIMEVEILSSATNDKNIRLQFFLPEGKELKSSTHTTLHALWTGEKHRIIVTKYYYLHTLLYMKKKEEN